MVAAKPLPCWSNATPSAFTAWLIAIFKTKKRPKTWFRTRFSSSGKIRTDGRPDKNTKFTTWFYRVVVNLCLDWQKKKQPVELNEDMPIIDERESADEAMHTDKQQQIALESAIAALPERQRTAINLCFDEGLSNQDAADVMAINLKALQSLVMRAKTTLKERLKNYL